jgi:ABC-type dipeptide/oligopeptide/nickel transport system permease component
MLRYLLIRVGQALLTLFAISVIVFALARLTGDPLDVLLPDWATPEMHEAMAAKLGLGKPYHEQYLIFMGSVVRGDFGTSVVTRQPIGPMFFSAMINSIKLIIVFFPLGVLLSIPLAIIAATRVGTIESRLVMGIAVFGQSAPAFFTGLILIWIFSVKLGLLPSARMTGWTSYILPGVTEMFFTLAAQTRILRNSLLRVLGSDFIKLVRLKGASERIVLWKHALRNGSIAMLTRAGQAIARLVVGAVVVETVFAWPGAGRLIYQGIMSRDYPLIQTSVLVICAMMVIMSVIVDVIYAYIDPRIRIF